jgi:hypothetical protein
VSAFKAYAFKLQKSRAVYFDNEAGPSMETSVARCAVLLVAPIAMALTSCAVQRAQVAHDAQDKMIGLRKEQVLACMGVPANKATEGATEVWSYNSGNDKVVASTVGSSTTNASVQGQQGYATGQSTTNSSGVGVASRRFCTVNVVITGGIVSKVNYVGPTGGLLTAGEQCAFAVQNCVQ